MNSTVGQKRQRAAKDSGVEQATAQKEEVAARKVFKPKKKGRENMGDEEEDKLEYEGSDADEFIQEDVF